MGEARISPDGKRIAYTVQSNLRTGRPASQIWIWDRAAGTTARLGGDRDSGANVRWSPDGQSLAFTGRVDDESGLMVQRLDGSPALALGRVLSTNHPLPSTGSILTWSPGSSRVAIANGVPGPEGAEADGDPMVITRYLFKPGAAEGLTRFNDNRRLQIQMVDLVSHEPRPLTSDTYHNHSLDWSPKGDEILFVSNREADPDRVFNYDLFAVSIARASVPADHRHESAEYHPVVVARRLGDRDAGHHAPAHFVGNDDGGHARLGDEGGRHRDGGRSAPSSTTARARRSGRPTARGSTSPCRSAATSGCTACRPPGARPKSSRLRPANAARSGRGPSPRTARWPSR